MCLLLLMFYLLRPVPHTEPATASITPSERNVDVGENVEVLCVVEGSELSDIG